LKRGRRSSYRLVQNEVTGGEVMKVLVFVGSEGMVKAEVQGKKSNGQFPF